MRWNCPHCGVGLGLPDHMISSGWSFSRCFQCGGFGLIRKAEFSVVKVDKAPADEKILLPDASDNPALAVMSGDALRNYAEKTSLNSLRFDPPSPVPESFHQPVVPLGIPSATPPTVHFNKFEQESHISQKKYYTYYISLFFMVSLGSLVAYSKFDHIMSNASVEDAIGGPPVVQKPAPVVKKKPREEDSMVKKRTEIKLSLDSDHKQLLAGPGVEYPSLHKTKDAETFIVSEWYGKWLKIYGESDAKKFGWVPFDKVTFLE